jgi:hypothetical protein
VALIEAGERGGHDDEDLVVAGACGGDKGDCRICDLLQAVEVETRGGHHGGDLAEVETSEAMAAQRWRRFQCWLSHRHWLLRGDLPWFVPATCMIDFCFVSLHQQLAKPINRCCISVRLQAPTSRTKRRSPSSL